MWDRLVVVSSFVWGWGGLRTLQCVWLRRLKVEHWDVYRLFALTLRWLFMFLILLILKWV